MLRVVGGGAVLVIVTGCATLGARDAPAAPPLEIPEPPPRVITRAGSDAVGGVRAPDVADPDEVAAAPERPGVGAVDAPAASTDEPGLVSPSSASPPLSLASSSAAATTPDAVRTVLMRMTDRLDGVDRRTLSSARRVQYDTARRFLDQATTALAAGNVTFAHYLGEKASTLVRDLVPE